MTLAFPAEKNRAKSLHLPLRADVWGHWWTGLSVRRSNVSVAKNACRRDLCERDFMRFKMTYFPHLFNNPCSYHIEISARKQAITLLRESGVYQEAEAAPRSIGKTTDNRAWVIWCLLYAHVDFSLFLTLNTAKACEQIKAIKDELLRNDLLAEDFPDICEWVRSHGGDPRRCKILYPQCEWSDQEICLPNGYWICAYGMDAALPGLNKNGKRPKLIILEDVEDAKIASSAAQQQTLRERISLEVLRLCDINHRCIYWFTATIYAKDCVADEITDPARRPEWRGKRYPALKAWPKRQDLVDTFADLYRGAAVERDKLAFATTADVCGGLQMSLEKFESLIPGYQDALRFYVANRAEIERGAELLDPFRLPLHRCLEEWSRDARSFALQMQNDPPEQENTKTIQLDVEHLLARRIGEGRGIAPSWAQYLTASIDVGAYVLHWEVDAWDAELRTSCLIDQGGQETELNSGAEYKMTDDVSIKQVMVADAVQRALTALREKLATAHYVSHGGSVLLPSLIGVDCGGTAATMAWYEIVLRFCAAAPRWIPLKGSSPWHRTVADRAMGRNWICEANNNPGRRHDCNVDEYKLRVANALNAPARLKDSADVFPGSRILHADTPHVYCKQQTAEYWAETLASEDVRVGKEIKIGWNLRGGRTDNHWWDTAWMAYAIADILKFSGGPSRSKKSYGVVGKAF